ncbi:MAG: Hydrolase, TatD family [Verrucomicrobiales bacterium]|jgi:TatD DNase family protein|nr:Hydrolase, TatD family [Verrucomicrobiales bacterium]
MIFYDTHAHLDYPDYAGDFAEMLKRALDGGITKMISIGTDLESSARAISLADKYPPIYAAVGWHPSNALEAPADIRSELRRLGKHPKVVALGETGLDYHHLPSEKPESSPDDDARYKEKQAQLFDQHLEVAAELGLNCVIHQRNALEDTLAQIEPHAAKVRGVFHCFVDNADTQKRIDALGSLVSFTGISTFKNAQSVRDTIFATALDRLMLETDCPYLAPVPYRGKRCEPAYVRHIAETVASVKNCSLEALSQATCRTAHEFFRGLQ